MNPLFRKFQNIAFNANLSDNTKRSKEHFARKVSIEDDIHNIDRLTRGLEVPRRIVPGMMLIYEYLAKGSGTLPYWDRHPLVFVLDVKDDGWIGVNLHYLHPMMRAKLFYDMDAKKVHFGSNKVTRNATKKYLASKVIGRVKEVPSNLWEVASQIPFENFQKSNKYNVWKDTNRKSK